MKILVVNDDGINSNNLLELAKHLRKYGEVVVASPSEEQSASSQAGTFFKEFQIEELKDYALDIKAYKVYGKPSDCVWKFVEKSIYVPDIVFSGINYGYNLGSDIGYSGTVGACFTANNFDIKAVALSEEVGYPGASIKYLDTILEFVFEKINDFNDTLNINIPRFIKDEEDLFRYTAQAKSHNRVDFIYAFNNTYLTDIEAVNDGYISISILDIDRNNYQELDKFIGGK